MADIKFVYQKPIAIVSHMGKIALAIGDLHLGLESKLKKKGINIDRITERMTAQILDTADEFNATEIVILGDIKDSILYPERNEYSQIEKFFNELNVYKTILLSGNHDSHLSELFKIKLKDEYTFGRCVFLHGNRWPSEKSMANDFIFIGHSHMAISIKENDRIVYNDKVWMRAKLMPKNASLRYKKFNKKLEMIAMPAFNPFITGTNILESDISISPIIKNKIFDYMRGNIYTLSGELLGNINTLKKK